MEDKFYSNKNLSMKSVNEVQFSFSLNKLTNKFWLMSINQNLIFILFKNKKKHIIDFFIHIDFLWNTSNSGLFQAVCLWMCVCVCLVCIQLIHRGIKPKYFKVLVVYFFRYIHVLQIPHKDVTELSALYHAAIHP